jgi:antitoxin VapB
MPLSIKDPKTDRLARDLARRTGESITEAVTRAIEERLVRVAARSRGRSLADELMDIGRRCTALPSLDDRSPEEIVGYDERGLPR